MFEELKTGADTMQGNHWAPLIHDSFNKWLPGEKVLPLLPNISLFWATGSTVYPMGIQGVKISQYSTIPVRKKIECISPSGKKRDQNFLFKDSENSKCYGKKWKYGK